MTTANFIAWDGSHLGNIDEMVTEEKHARPLKYLYLKGNGFDQWISYHKSDTLLPCIIDEMAPIFTIRKIGTHSARLNDKLIIIYNTPEEYGDISKYPRDLMTIDFKLRVQDVLAFRLFAGLGLNWPTSIVIKGGYPCSYNNKVAKTGPNTTKISITTTCTMFVDDISDTKKRMNIDTPEEVFALQSQIQEIISRINKQLFWYENFIIDSINRLV